MTTNPYFKISHGLPVFLSQIFPLLLCGLFPTAGLLAADETQGQNQPTIQIPSQALANLQLEFGQVEPRPVSASTPVTGTIQLDSTRVYDVVPRISGIVAKDYHSLGDKMKTGEPLLQLESKELAAALIKYFESEHELEHATKSYSREKSLVEKKVSSSELLLTAEHDYRIAQINHTASLQLLKLLHFPEAELHRLLIQVDHADLTLYDLPSPAEGIIINKEVRLGSDVKPDQVLYTVADLSQLWVDIQVPIREAGSLRLGATVDLSTAIDQRSASAKVIYVASVADDLTRTILARAALDNKDGSWRPGTPVTIQLRDPAESLDDKGSPPIAVPSGAVFDIENEKAVFVQVSQDSFRMTPVKIGADDGKFIRILSGLKTGDTVVTRNVVQLKAQVMMKGEN
jgi:cobalt-zinc-cadmium efflux system membrane fusion protein